ncbi:MAG: phosphoribosylformylglycinamidine cyclo-ligase [Candidatus Melainabacteria bacterium]|nr:MAG: phosphoribosylformylglycinamidine cyclo-ligase [Candidatus Melainabacteria bacterium]
MDTKPKTYQDSGVDIEKADRFVGRLKNLATRKGHKELWSGAGGYASVYPVDGNKGIALTTDGVGTKLLLAIEQKKYDTIGIDLVAMCANDLICVGARPQAFLDYYAIGKINDDVSDAIIKGIVEGCDQAGMLLVGGETAEMPDLYSHDHFDLAGFAMGVVQKSELITGDKIKANDLVIGVASSGIHSNGFSLARKLIKDGPMRSELLTPTLIYCKPVVELLDKFHDQLSGIAHITGGGWTNLFRLNKQVSFQIENKISMPKIIDTLASQVDITEMYKTFNMGIGLFVTAQAAIADDIVKVFQNAGFEAATMGEVSESSESESKIEVSGNHKVLLRRHD